MYSGLFQSTTIPMLQEAVNFAQTRHPVLAGNLANMDTPGYQARDLSVEDFQQKLKAAVDEKRRPRESLLSEPWSPGGLGVGRSKSPMAEVSENPKTITRHDKGEIRLEHEVTEITKNQMQHNLALTLLVNQFRLLQTAISERV